MACDTPPLKVAKKQGEMPSPSLSPIPFKSVEFRDGMGPRLSNGISPCFFAFLRDGVWQAFLKSFSFWKSEWTCMIYQLVPCVSKSCECISVLRLTCSFLHPCNDEHNDHNCCNSWNSNDYNDHCSYHDSNNPSRYVYSSCSIQCWWSRGWGEWTNTNAMSYSLWITLQQHKIPKENEK